MSTLGDLNPLRSVRTDTLEIAYFESGPPDANVVLLLHGYPYDIHSYVDVIPLLADAGLRVIVPYLRGHGPTRFLDPSTPRSGKQAALGRDVIELMDALGIPRAVLAGYDWGARAACIVAALWPERCAGIVSVNGYLIQDIAAALEPIRPELEAGFWYFFYFATERGRRGLTANRQEIARVIWTRTRPPGRSATPPSIARHARSRTLTTSPSSSTPTATASDSPPETRDTTRSNGRSAHSR
jgi:pimeloyl-ACP methyl ester carboxylesterase